MTNFEFEEFADMAIDELHSFINIEERLVEEEHNLYEKLYSWDYVIAHLDERIPSGMKGLHALNKKISKSLIEIRELIESERLKDLRIIEEESKLFEKLKIDAARKNWKAVKYDIDYEAKEEYNDVRLKTKELGYLHSKFSELARIMEKNELKKAISHDIKNPRQKEGYERLEEYYFIQLYKFISTYERIFEDLLKKEIYLSDKLKKQVKIVKAPKL